MSKRRTYMALEQRILLDAAGVATAAETLPDPIDNHAAEAEQVQQDGIDSLINAFAAQDGMTDSGAPGTIIFVDSRVENPAQLLESSLVQNARIYTIAADVDGLDYIASVLKSQDQAPMSVHILSHGSAGELLLGNTQVTTESLEAQHSQSMATISGALDESADILFYGCNVAEGEQGERFMARFASLSGADVAASTDLTGGLLQGGDADLEFQLGELETSTILTTASLANYDGLLGPNPPDAGGNITATDTADAAVNINEDAGDPGTANIRLTPTTLNDSDSATPNQIRVISVDGGTLQQTDGSAITLGASGTALSLSADGTPHYDFRFIPDSNRDTNATFSYVVVDADGGVINSSASTATISMTAVNDAPTANNVTLPNVDEDTSAPAGTTVTSLFSAGFSDPDTGASLGGIAVIGNSADFINEGSWEYSTDGSAWHEIGTVADDGTALALSASTQLRFVPAADYNGTPTALTVRVLDDTQTQFTEGTSRVTVDTSSNGGSSAIAATTNTVGVTVDPVNDAPDITEAGEFADIVEDQAPNNGVQISTFLSGLVEDGEDNSSQIGLAIVGSDFANMSDTSGDWEYSTDGGSNWTAVGAVANTNALLLGPSALLRFTPNPNQVGSAELTYKVWDGSSGTEGSKENLTTGDTNRTSSTSFSSSIAVTPVNDDPANLTGNSKTIAETDTYVIANTDLAFTAIAGAPNEQTAEQIVYQLDTLTSKGNIQKDFGGLWVTLGVGSLFSQKDIDDGKVRYQYTGGELSANTSDSFAFTVRDGAGSEQTSSFNLTINDVNASLSLTGTTISVNERIGTEAADVNVISIGVSDADITDDSAVVFTLKTLPATGHLEIDSGSGFVDAIVGSTFSKDDLNNSKVRYIHDTSEPTDGAETWDGPSSTTFDVDVTDGNTSLPPSTLSNQTITLNIQPVNDDPVPDNTIITIDEGDTYTFDGSSDLNIDDVDSSRSRFTFILDSVPSDGALYRNLDGDSPDAGFVRLSAGSLFLQSDIDAGRIQYVHFGGNPDADAGTVDDSFTYTVRDRDGAAVASTFEIKVTPDDTDSGGNTTEGVGSTDPGGTVLNPNSPPVIDIPVAGEITISVIEHDDGSTDDSDAQTLGDVENAYLLSLTELTGSDVDFHPDSDLIYEVTSPPPGGELKIWNGSSYVSLTNSKFTVQDIKDGKVAYFHNADSEPQSATHQFTVQLTDGGGVPSAAKTININVTNSNDAPTAGAASLTVNEGGTQDLGSVLNGKFNDSDADDTPANLTLVVTGLPSNGLLRNTDTSTILAVNDTFTKADLDNGYIQYEHDGTENFSDSFTYKSRDDGSPNLESGSATVSVAVRPVNDDPTISTNTGIVLGDNGYENESTTITTSMLLGADPDNSDTQVQFRITSNVANGTLKVNGKALGAGSVFTLDDLKNGLVTYEHSEDAVLTDAFTFKVSDGGGGNEPEQTFNIALNAVNDSPELVVPGAVSLLEDTSKNIKGITIDDVDAGSDDLIVTLSVTNGTLGFANESLSAAVLSGMGTDTVTVTGTLSEINTMLGQGVDYTANANFAGSDSLSINVNDQGSTGIDPNGVGAITQTTDSGGASNQQADGSVAITVKPVNDGPSIDAAPGAQTVDEDTNLDLGGFSFSDIDVETNDIVTVTLSVDPNSESGGTVTVNNTTNLTVSNNGTSTVTVSGKIADINSQLGGASSVTYLGGANYNGSDQLSVVFSDEGNTGVGGVKTDSTTVGITVSAVNDAPDVSTPVTATGSEDNNISVALSAASVDLDGDGSPVVSGFTVTSLPANGTLYFSNGTTPVTAGVGMSKAEAESLIFTPTAEFNGATTFQYTATDGSLTSSAQTGTITVNAVNDGPGITVTSSGVTFTEGSGLDVDGTPVDLSSGSVSISDIELIDRDEDSFNGAQLAVSRSGSDSADDKFSIDDSGSISLSSGSDVGSDISIDGDVIGSIQTNSAGQLVVEFSALAEASDVNTVAEAILYVNTSDAPPSSVNIDFSFSDGNTDSGQGTGGNLSATDSVTVSITGTNDAPIGKDASFSSNEDADTPATLTLSSANLLQSDPDGDAMGYVAFVANTANAGTEGKWQVFTGGSWNDISTGVTESSSLVVAADTPLRFVPVSDYNGTPGTLSYHVIDDSAVVTTGSGISVAANGGTTQIADVAKTLSVTIDPINDAPVIAGTNLSPSVSEIGGSIAATALIDSSSIAIATSDVDATHFNGGSITVSLDTYVSGDVLSLAGSLGAGDGVASTSGGSGADLVINLNSNATPAQVNAIIAAVRYSHTGDNPTAAGSDPSRDYSIILNDGGQSGAPSTSGTTGTPQNSNALTGTITITSENDAPVGAADGISVDEDVAEPGGVVVNTLSIYSDADGDTFAGIAVVANNASAAEGVWQFSNNGSVWSDIGAASDGAAVVIAATDHIRFKPGTNFNGTPAADSLSVRVLDDGYAGSYSTAGASPSIETLNTSSPSATAVFAQTATPINITVNPQNDAPVFSNVGGTISFTEGVGLGVLGTPQFLDTDASVSDVELSGLDNAASNDFDGATVTLQRQSGANPEDFFGVVTGGSVTVTGSDISIASTTVATITSNTGGSMLLTFASGATQANVDDVLRQITYANSSDNPPASVTVQYTFNDQNGGAQGAGGAQTGTATVDVSITATNDDPAANPNTGSVTEDGTLTNTGNLISDATADSDPDGDDLDISNVTFTGSTVTDNGTTLTIDGTYGQLVITKETGAYTYTLDNGKAATQALDQGDVPTEVFTYTLDDGNSATDTATLTISVNGANDAPTVSSTISNQTNNDADAGISLNVAGNFADVDADDSRTFTATGLPPGLSIDLNSGLISGTIDADASTGGTGGVYSVTVTAKDSNNATVDATFDWTVSNPSPTANPNTGSVTEDGTSTATGNLITDATADSDPDGDDLDITNVTFTGSTVTDDGTTLTIDGTFGQLVITKETGAYTYTLDNSKSATQALDQGDTPTEAFTYTLNDNEGGTDTSTLTIGINGANDTPTVAAAIGNQASEDANVIAGFDVSGNFADVDADDTRTYTATGLPAGLSIDLNTGVISGTIDNSASAGGTGGVYNVTVTAKDSNNATVDATFDWTVTNPAPTANPDTGSVTEDGTSTATGNLITDAVADSDPLGEDLDISTVAFTGSTVTDNGTTLTIDGTYGQLVITKETGEYTYTLDNSKAATQALDQGDTPTEVFTYTLIDEGSITDTSTLTITVNGANDLPTVASAISNQSSNDADTGISLNVAGNFADVDADDSRTFTATGLPPGLSIDLNTGLISGTIDADASTGGTAGVYSVTVTAEDSNGATVDDSFDWTISNPAPTANPNSSAVTEDGTLTSTGNLISDATADSDPDGDDLDISNVTFTGNTVTDNGTTLTIDGTYGQLVITKGTGGYTYTLDNSKAATQALDQGDTPTEEFTYTLTDNEGGTDTSTLTVTVNGANDAPTVSSAVSNQTNNDADTGISLNVAGNFADVDADDTRTFTATGLPPGLSIDLNSGLISGTIDANASTGGTGGVYSVTVTAKDSNNATVDATFDWTVSNLTPTANPNTGSVTEDGTSTASGNLITDATADSDPDGDDLDISNVTFTGSTVTDNGTTLTIDGTYGQLVITKETGAYTYTLDNSKAATQALDQGDTPTEAFTYTLTDNEGGTDTSTLTIGVNGANDAPTVTTAISDTSSPSNTPLSIDVSGNFNDVDADDSITYSATGLPPGVTINPTTGEISGTPDPGSATGGPGSDGVFVVTVTATDSKSATGTDTFNLTIGNTAPVASNDAASITEGDTSVTGNVITDATADSDFDGDDLDISTVAFTGSTVTDDGTTLTIDGDYGQLVITKETGAYTYTLNNSNTTVEALAVGASLIETFTYTLDDSKATDTADLVITINGSNDAPVIDLDGDDSSGATGADFDSSFTEGDTAISVVDSDISIADADDAQMEGATLTLTNAQTGDKLAITALPAGITGSVSGNTVTLSGSASISDYRTALQAVTFENTSQNPDTTDRVFSIKVNDGDADSNVATTTITVTAVNDAPVAADDIYTINQGSTLNGGSVLLDNGAGLDSDFEGDALSVTPIGPLATAQGGTVTVLADGTFTYEPPSSGFTGSDSFDYTVSDGTLTDTGTVTINVQSTAVPNAIPTAVPDAETTNASTTVGGNVLDNDSDADGDSLSVAPNSTAGTGGGAFTFDADGDYLFDPNGEFDDLAPGESRTTSATYQVVDSKGATSSATVTITVTGANASPAGQPATFEADSGSGGITGAVAASDPDGADDIAGFSLASGPAEGELTFNADGSFSFAENGDFDDLASGETRSVTFTYSVTDKQGAVSEPVTVTLTITGLNAVPTGQAATFESESGSGGLSGTVTGSDPDGADDIAGFSLASSPASGVLTFNADGSFDFDENGDFDDLAAGETRSVSFTYTVVDAQGAVSAPVTVTITITGKAEGSSTNPGTETGGGTDPGTGTGGGTNPDPGTGTGGGTDPNPGTGTGGGSDPNPGTGGGSDPNPGTGTGGGTDPNPGTDPGTGTGDDTASGSDENDDTDEPPVFVWDLNDQTGDPADGGGDDTVVAEPGTSGASNGAVGGGGGSTGGGGGGGTGDGGTPTTQIPTITPVSLVTSAASDSISQLTLTLALDDQLITTQGRSLFSIPSNAFDNGGTAPITIEATQADGSALPDFLVFNADDLSFSVDGEAAAEAGVEEIIIRVTGSDSNGSSASGTFIIVVVEDGADQATEQQAQPAEPDNNDQAKLLPQDTTSQYAVMAEIQAGVADAAENTDTPNQQVSQSFFDKLEAAANEVNEEDKLKQFLSDLKELVS